MTGENGGLQPSKHQLIPIEPTPCAFIRRTLPCHCWSNALSLLRAMKREWVLKLSSGSFGTLRVIHMDGTPPYSSRKAVFEGAMPSTSVHVRWVRVYSFKLQTHLPMLGDWSHWDLGRPYGIPWQTGPSLSPRFRRPEVVSCGFLLLQQ